MENPTTNNTPAEEEVKQEETTTQVAADGERTLGIGEENKEGEGKSWVRHLAWLLLSLLINHALIRNQITKSFGSCISTCLGEEAEELFETNWDLEVDNFDDMGLKEEVLRGIYAFGFKEPSPIQQKGILPII